MGQSLVGFWLTLVPAASRPAAFDASLALLLLGIGLSAAAAQLLMTWSYGRLDVATGSLLSMLTPVINVAVGVLAFREALGPVEAVGAAVVVAACAAVMVPSRRAPAPGLPSRRQSP
jgi:drug/metabolite transporter (DMT)-like permease